MDPTLRTIDSLFDLVRREGNMAKLRVSDEARDNFKAFAETHGVSMSALLECFIWKVNPETPWDDLTPGQRDAITEARAVDAERRSRETPR